MIYNLNIIHKTQNYLLILNVIIFFRTYYLGTSRTYELRSNIC